jgi:hypothetical protein
MFPARRAVEREEEETTMRDRNWSGGQRERGWDRDEDREARWMSDEERRWRDERYGARDRGYDDSWSGVINAPVVDLMD